MDVKEALSLHQTTKSYWSEIYQAFREDVRFSIGLDHWSDQDIKTRGASNCMIVPILPQFIHQVVNDERMNTPSINVIPAEGGNSDMETAKIFKGLIRNIEYKSQADEVYDTAGEYAVRGGFGFARVINDYIDDESDLQELKLMRVHNPEAVYLDPSYTQPDGSDANFGYILDVMSKDDFAKKYPDKEFISFTDAPITKLSDSDKEITICEFFVKKTEEIIGGKRPIRKITIERYKFSGGAELEKTIFPGKYIPIVPFLGEEVWVGGKRNYLSLIRLAKDAQRRVNKWASKESEILDMAPIAPILAPYGSVEDFADEYSKQGEVNVIRYRQQSADGTIQYNKPERLAPPPIPTGIINAMEGAKQNVKEALGMYNASIGQKSNAISGVAYDAQKLEADVATFHFSDNRNRSIQHLGRILVCAIPEVYDTDRIIRIIGEEDEPKLVGVNGAPMQEGQKQQYDLRKGMYDVRVTTGASYTSKRQEAAALMGDIINKNPALIEVVGDLMFKNMDVAGAEQIAARLKKRLPPEFQDDENGEQEQDPQKIQMAQMIEQLQAQLQQAMQQGQAIEGELKSKQGELQVKAQDTQSKLQIEAMKLQASQQQIEMEAQIKQAELQLKARELDIKEQELAMKASMQPTESEDEMSLPKGLKITKTDEQLQMEDVHHSNSMTMKQQELQAKYKEIELEQIEIEQRGQQAEAIVTVLADISNKLSELGRPKQVQYDNAGNIIGVV